MKTAWLYLRHTTDKRYQLFSSGLKKHGFKIQDGLPPNTPGDQDIFVTWNRLAAADKKAKEFEARGQRVLVAENASWGNRFQNENWFHVAQNEHNTIFKYNFAGNERWDDLNVDLKPFKNSGGKLILSQRGIGTGSSRMPAQWPQEMKKSYKCKIRKHPGKKEIVPLEKDLKGVGTVITWGSGAAIKALILGVKVISYMPYWIGEQDNTEEGRINMFRDIAWAQWRHCEIENGYAFERLLW